MRYDHKKIESKWQKHWDANKTFKADIDPSKPKYYVLDMFPFTSGAGLHVGHVLGYTATDILARYKRQKGFNVLHPMGWDSFGLPAEQHAIRKGTHPAITTEKNIDNFRKQLKSLGFSYDWDREFGTHQPTYYKWTQWIFTKLYEKGLAYEAKMPVNWCPAFGTVLANEEVENGKSVEGGHPVERRPLRQWVLKITEYADRLLEDLDQIDWPESLKRLQRNWIGKSEGAQVDFPIKGKPEKITVFTTRPDTLFGATYMVLAPEHPLVEKIATEKNLEEVKAYQKLAASKSDMDRTDLSKEKTGAFIGAYAINPVNDQEIPIWISDYVLVGYGTGAIMAVPAHDERDFEFALVHKLPIVSVFDPNLDAHPELIPDDRSLEKVRQEVMDGIRCWSGEGTCIHSANPEVSLNGLSVTDAIKSITDWLEKKDFGKKAVSYKLRDWLFSRQRYWGEPFPILHFEDGTKRVLDLDELPLCPPEITDYKPTGDGQSPLAKVKEWVEITDPKTGKKAKRETNTMPQWAGSCWYYLRFCDPNNTEAAWSPETEKYWLPVDMYVGGVEHAVLHLLYARFWHKVLYDCGLVSTSEPFKTLRNQGLIVARAFKNGDNMYVPTAQVKENNGRYFHQETGEELTSQIEKMSKSKLNGVNPNEIIEEFGTDSLRIYEMFMGPLDKEKIWNTDAVSGPRRFLNRFYEIVQSDKVTDEETPEALKLGYRLVHGVEKDIKNMFFNTAIAKMMEFLNDFTKLPSYPRRVLKMATQALMPFAPHLAEEAWEILGGEGELAYHPWPEVDESYLHEEITTYVVQVNGKLRGRFDLPKGLTKEEILDFAKKDPNVSRFIDGKEIRKVVFVPDKLLNLVI
ncbi:MAG: Leucine--tRNA ligase [Chlamydiae bacterium]|nr:Leucine--tRNA ligase [Chlamydiota bacterium]